MAIHSSILAWKILWTEEPGGLQPMGVIKSWTQQSGLSTHARTYVDPRLLIHPSPPFPHQ